MNGFDRNIGAEIAKCSSYLHTDIEAKQRIASE
jgi:hypothetical protein